MSKISLISIFLLLFVNLEAQKFEVSFSSEVMSESFSGNVILYLSKENKNPKDAFHYFELQPVFRVNVDEVVPEKSVVFDDNAVSYPVEISNLERGTYYVQAVFDRNLGGQFIGMSPGNIYSNSMQVHLDKNYNAIFHIDCDQIIDEIPFKETPYLKELKIKSKLISEFHQQDTYIAGAVSIPKEYYKNPKNTYPVIFSIFGFGGNYKIHAGDEKYHFSQLDNKPAIVVYLDGNCSEGHSVYANSDINGPWGDALVKEFIPELEKRFRTNTAKLLFGHSSGGWTVLWLQINYPDVFAGAWSSAPDPVDFRNWQGENLYETNNLFYDANGDLIADCTLAGRYPLVNAKDVYRMENVINRGEQMHSFDAVFSKIDANGNVIRLVDPVSGNVNKKAIEYFKRYDISYQLRQNWAKYDGKIIGKIRISVGENDNWYLQKSVYLLEEEMKKTNAGIEFEYFPGDHLTVFTDDYREKGQAFLDKCYRLWLKDN
jgi:S-formylglutathione hydrolase FrmB